MASTSSTRPSYDVFISYRGKDIQDGFVSHLFNAFQQKKINTFLDENLCKGEEISPALLAAIEESYVSVVIFSDNYADSSWCLNELVKILECRKTLGQIVLPVFYHVDPTDVQELTGNFGKAFTIAKHVEELKGCLDRVEQWRHALMEISIITEWDSRNFKSESKLVEEIVNDVCEKLSHFSSSDFYIDNLVGIESPVMKVESLLSIESTNNKRVIGIWGMGGIGKTTIANEVYSRIMTKFDSYCFVDNVKEQMRKRTAIALRDKIIEQLLGEKNLRINTPQLPAFIKRRLRSKKVVIVFDDVDDPNLLNLLAGDCDLYHNGSRIIVTSRDRHLLKSVCDEDYIYEVEKLIDDEALCLFSLYAFKQNHPKNQFVNLSKRLITYAQGNPLALRILGSNLCDKEIEEWESELEKLKEIPDMNIQAVLKTSYDGLEHDEKSSFLDIACFFKGEPLDHVERILEGCGFFPGIAISRLIDKSLINVSDGKVGMHDLLQQMGKEIVYEESKQPRGRSRLWNYKDICHVLTTETGTENVEGILLDMPANEYLKLRSTAFKKMYNLRFLKLSNDPFSREGQVLLPRNDLEILPEQLRYLHWGKYPLKSLPLNFCAKYLVELHMPGSKLIQLWNRDKALENLKFLYLSDSLELTRVPELSSIPKLELLFLDGCRSLIEIPSSIGELKCLKEISLIGCEELHSIPQSICNLKFLTQVDISYCLNVTELPENIGDLELLEFLCIIASGIKTLPSSINQPKNLRDLACGECEGLALPPLTGLSRLWRIDLRDTGMLEIPQSIWDLVLLSHLHLGGNNFESIPASIKQLPKLKCLGLNDCKRLKYLPELPCLEDKDEDVLYENEETYLDFHNCINLDKDVCEKVTEDVFEKHLLQHKIVKLCIVGNEVPQRMRYKNQSGSSLSFTEQLPNLIGFSFCAVCDPKNCSGDEMNEISCEAQLIDKSGRRSKDFRFHWVSPRVADDLLYSEHVFLWNHRFDMEDSIVKASFQFYIHMGSYGTTYHEDSAFETIIKCGVQPIFRDYGSNLTQLQNGDKPLGNLKILNLGGPFELTRVTDLSIFPNLVVLRLSECSGLIEIPSSIGELKCLKKVFLSHCEKLQSIPQSICNLKSLTDLEISYCLNVNELPENIGDLELLETLDISGSGIKPLPSSFNQLQNLGELTCGKCEGLTLPPLTGLSRVKRIVLGGTGILEIPQSLLFLVSLRYLDLGENNFESIPASIRQLFKFSYLFLNDCKRLKFLEDKDEDEDEHEQDTYLEFQNSINLDKDVCEKLKEYVFEMHLLKKKVVKLCIFGDEVPQRMRYKNQIGSSLSFTLDQPNLIGFSFCAVCDPTNFLGDDMADITCEAQFIDKSGHSNKKFRFDWVTVKDVNLLCSEHVFLWNDSFDMEDGPVAASFQFFVDRVFIKAKYRKDRDYSAIIKCGVHPMFGDDCVGRDNKKRSRSQEDEDDELSFQRLKQDEEPSHTLDKSDSE